MSEALPEIDFGTFVMSLASSVLVHLGEIAHPDASKNLNMAKQTIDILGMLQDKTRGNLDAQEARLFEKILFDLRLRFVEKSRK